VTLFFVITITPEQTEVTLTENDQLMRDVLDDRDIAIMPVETK
jgi:hypothetical protein